MDTSIPKSMPAGNMRLAQWGLTSKIESSCFYSTSVQVDSLVFLNPPLRQAQKRYSQVLKNSYHYYLSIYRESYRHIFKDLTSLILRILIAQLLFHRLNQ